MAISTYGVTLKWGKTSAALTKVIDIKNFPDLGGAPEVLETTTLSDETQTFIIGIQSADAMAFTANYTKDDYTAVKADAGKDLYYSLEFGDDGDEGIFEWQGQHSVYVTGADVNGVVEMVITIAPSTKPEPKYVLTFDEKNDVTLTTEVKQGDSVITPEADGTYKLYNGTYTYKLTATGYETQTGTVVIYDEDKTIEVTMVASAG
jgi:hypothetical protein